VAPSNKQYGVEYSRLMRNKLLHAFVCVPHYQQLAETAITLATAKADSKLKEAKAAREGGKQKQALALMREAKQLEDDVAALVVHRDGYLATVEAEYALQFEDERLRRVALLREHERMAALKVPSQAVPTTH
jgi:hypothetical protein